MSKRKEPSTVKSDGSVAVAAELPAASMGDFVRPADWPAEEGDIDLVVHDLPHASSDTEWWYVNGHAKAADGHEFSYFASFFRIFKEQDKDGNDVHAHALNWAIVDNKTQRYHGDPIVDRSTPTLLTSQLKQGVYNVDKRLNRSFQEILAKDEVPLPDRMFMGEVKVPLDTLDLDFSGQTFTKLADGSYDVHCENEEKGIAFTLNFNPKKKMIRHGHGGTVKIGLKADTMFYYFCPRCDVKGDITVDGKKHTVTGNGWYDHEFGGTKKYKKKEENQGGAEKKQKVDTNGKGKTKNAVTAYAWNWLAVQLEDGTDITATTVVNPKTNELYDNFAVIIGPNSEREEHDMSFEGSKPWMSIRTTMSYPSHWEFKCPGADMHLHIDVAFKEQEFMTLISKPGFWEGRIHVTGTYKGKPVKGLGFIERHGFEQIDELDDFFKKMSTQVQAEIEKVMPLEPNHDQVRTLMANDHMEHIMEGVDRDVFAHSIIKPLREIVDRGGKAWRSFAVLLCCDAVGGFSEDYRHWIAMPELMHVGSLIVDDIQDKSEKRRGGPAAHHIYGKDVAINAGTSAYFFSLHILQKMTPNLSDKMRVEIYDLYFLTLSAGHAGQAFDIKGLYYLMEEGIASGNAAKLLAAVECTHLLKSGAPAGCLARMGARVGGGTKEQNNAIGLYFESIGIAFQIIDDVLNLRGMPGKTKGEDIHEGKITYPIAMAMSKVKDQKERQRIFDVVKSKTQDEKVVHGLIDELEANGSLPASEQRANDIVNEAWARLEPLLKPSFYKMMLRSFGFYVLERHY